MSMENVNVEELSRRLEGDRTVIIQEVTGKQREWIFRGEQLQALHEQSPERARYDQADEVIFVCEQIEECEAQACKVPNGVKTGYLAGGYLAWGQFYHPVMVGFDERVTVWQIHRLAKGCLSYMVVSGKECLVIDPCYHIDYYLGLAHSQQADINCLIDTQIHTDHVSGGPRLAAKTGSPYYLPSHEKFQTESKALEKEQQIKVGEAQLQVIPLPSSQGDQQQRVLLLLNEQYLFTGDAPLDAVRESVQEHGNFRQKGPLLILPAHLSTLGRINEHGIVATTIDQAGQGEEAEQQSIQVSQPEVKEKEILQINLSQREITLDMANQMELGVDETPL